MRPRLDVFQELRTAEKKSCVVNYFLWRAHWGLERGWWDFLWERARSCPRQHHWAKMPLGLFCQA